MPTRDKAVIHSTRVQVELVYRSTLINGQNDYFIELISEARIAPSPFFSVWNTVYIHI